MKPGDPCEVLSRAWSHAKGTHTAWFGGYTFVRVDGDKTILRREKGMLGGIVRYPSGHVRPAQKKGETR
jgi:hypothetical protein